MKAHWLLIAAVIAIVPAWVRAEAEPFRYAPSPPEAVSPRQAVSEPEPAPPQEGGEDGPPPPPQEGGEQQPPAAPPPQEGGEQQPPAAPPPQEGGEQQPPESRPNPNAPAGAPSQPDLPQETGEQQPAPPASAGDNPAIPSQEGGEPTAPVPSQEGGEPAAPVPSQEGGERATPLPHGSSGSLEGGPLGDQPERPAPVAPPPVPESAERPASRPRVAEIALEPELPFAMEAPFTLWVNGVDKGEIIVVLKDDDVLVRHQDLQAAGIKKLSGRDEQLFGSRLLSLKSVSPPLTYELDERDIALRIVAPIDLLPKQTLDLGGQRGDVTYQNMTSGFFNYGMRVSDFESLDVYQEVGASHEGNLAFSSMYLSTDHRPIRGLTNYTVNERETRRRLIIGDALVQTGTLGSSYLVGGFTLTKTFELDPYAVRSPRLGFAGNTLTPANIEVYVNGALIRTEPLQPGAFELNNLQVAGGRGLATYVIRDVFGQEQRISIPFYVSGSVLAKGFEEFTYTLGGLRENVGTESWGYDRIAFMGTHRRGITDQLTLSGRLEASDSLITGGPALTTSTPIGQIEVELAASHERDQGTGLATFLSYTFLSRYFSAGMVGRLVSDRYSTLNVSAAPDRVTHSASFFQSTPIGKRMSVSSRAQLARNRDSGKSWSVGGSLGARIIYQLNASISGGYGGYEGQDGQWDIFAGVSYVFAQKYFVSAQTRVTGGDAALDLTTNKSLPIGSGYGYRASATFDEISSANALVQYQAPFGRYAGGYTVFDPGRGKPLAHHYTLDAAGGIAVVPKVGLFATLPVSDGFGVIRVRGVKNVRGYISNKEIGSTDRNGLLVVPNLLSYYGNQLSIDPGDVPIRYTLDITDMTLAPPQRGLALADFEVTTQHYYRGVVVVDDRGKEVIPQFGQVRIPSQDGEIISPLGPQGEFDLEGLSAGSHQAFIDYTGGTCEMKLEAPEDDSPVVELGKLVCSLP